MKQIQKRGEEIDPYNARLSRRISRVLAVENSPSEANVLNRMFSTVGNAECIDDHAINIAGYARTTMERGLEFSSQASVESTSMKTPCVGAVRLIYSVYIAEFKLRPEQDSFLKQALLLEQDIDRRTARCRSNQIECMKKGKCHVETSILYPEILTDYERVGGHAFNITQAPDKLDEN